MAQIDEVISPAEQKLWLTDPEYMTDIGEPREDRISSDNKQDAFRKFLKASYSETIIEFLQLYMPRFIPRFMSTEQDLWAFSLQPTIHPRAVFALNGKQTLLDIIYENGDLLFRWYITRNELHNAFGESRERLKQEYPLIETGHTVTKVGGIDQVLLLIPDLENAIRLCHDNEFIRQVRAFNLRVLHEHILGTAPYHSFDLTNEIVKSIPTRPMENQLYYSDLEEIEDTSVIEILEGQTRVRVRIERVRDKTLVKQKKQEFRKEHNGRLYCEVCENDFLTLYGDAGEACIEVHHIIPIGNRNSQGETTSKNDLRLVCANCHKMIHYQKLDVEALRQIVKQNRR